MAPPDYWTSTTVGEVILPVDKHRPEDEPAKEFRYVDISSIDNGSNRVVEPKLVLGRLAPSRARQVVRAGDIVLSTVRTYLKNTAIVPDDLDGATASTGFSVLRSDPDRVDPRFLFYRVREPSFVESLSEKQTGTSYPAVRDRDVRAMAFSFPPLDEQRWIVEAIEEQLSRLDAGVESLQRAKRNLAHFRASVLRAAVEGRLVEQADDGSSQLDLRASLIEQRRLLHGVENPGKRLCEPESVEALGPTPAHWPVVPLSGLAETRLGKMLSKKSKTGTRPRPYLRNLNVQWHRFDLSDVAEMDIHEEEVDRYRLKQGDLLVCEGGEVGRCAVWEGAEGEMYYQKALHRVRPIPGVSPYYLALVFEYLTSNMLIGSFVTGSTIDHLPQEDLRRLPIPVPPFEEQLRMLGEVDRIASIAGAVANAVRAGRQRAAVLRNAVLRDAFNGSLSARSSLP